ncbi:MAG: sensor histidine kinase [Bacteroidetes bacterium]|nr:MAG: sensor histidine kinase [Bacteroidota bacterium]
MAVAIPKLSKLFTPREVLLFTAFYVVSSLIYYTVTWLTYSSFETQLLPFFNIEEFFAASGTLFIISFFVTIPIWYITSVALKTYSNTITIAAHAVLLPCYITACYYIQVQITDYFGWAMFWGGYKIVWLLYMLLLFYMVQFGFIHAYAYFQQFKKEQEEKVTLSEIALRSELTALKAQLNPHFLHNLFNSINASIPPENEKARTLIVQLSDLFRYQNYASRQELVTLGEELLFLENYLQLIKIRLKERLQYSITADEEVKAYTIAPMLLQPLVENAITHGIAPQIEPSTLEISVKKLNDKIHISIADTGMGITQMETIFEKGLGITNTQLRLQKMYNTTLLIEHNQPRGTKISFTI